MDPEEKKFGEGPKELTGASDLISHYNLQRQHEYFCKKPLPSSLSDTHYLHNIAGDTEIRKGEGMQLDQLLQKSPDQTASIQPFDIDVLGHAFHLTESTPVQLPSAEKGIPAVAGTSEIESKDEEKKRKEPEERDDEKEKEDKKHKSDGEDSGKLQEKKRKHNGDGDGSEIHRHKKSKHKSSKLDEIGAIKVAG